MSNKQVLGELTLNSGEKIQIFMPDMEDLEPIMMGQVQYSAYWVAALACGKSLEWFKALPAPEGVKILTIVGGAVQEITDALTKRGMN